MRALPLDIGVIHFVGIGGIGMSGIAEVLLTLGYKVSGSDLKRSAITDRLETMGARVFDSHRAENITDAGVVVTSSAVTKSNPEVVEARRRHIPVIPRAEMLSELMRLKYGIAIAGMHGKTTTTSMVAAVLQAGDLDPTVVVGGRVDALGSNARYGKSQYMVAEADESDRSFLKLSPIISVVTNIDREHLDCYRDMEDIEQTFLDFMDRVPFYGTVIACNDNEPLRALLPNVQRRVYTYGLAIDSDFVVTSDLTKCTVAPAPISCFRVRYRERDLGEFHLHVPGAHNVLNATAAIAVGIGLDVEVAQIREALESFRGVDRRFQFKGEVGGVRVLDDYGHHPTEIKATLAAARQCGFRHVHVIFQPHRYTRTQLLLDDFATAFGDADTVCVLDIYAASEPPIPGVTANTVAELIAQRGGRHAYYCDSFEGAIETVVENSEPGDVILTLGAGSVSQLGSQVVEALQSRAAAGANDHQRAALG
jgi:UDP-N-acetylmuramate--alanine ligase